MRSIKIIFAALALSAATSAFAAAAGQTQTVTVENAIVDTLAVSGTTVVTIDQLNTPTAQSNVSNPQLAYSTHAEMTVSAANKTSRKVTVSSTGLATGMNGTVSFAVAPGKGTAAPVDLRIGGDLVTAIPRFITQELANLSYTLEASQGFDEAAVIVTYTLADE